MTGISTGAPPGASEEDLEGAFRQHRSELQVHCYRMLGSLSEAEDLLQETFERAWRAREGFHGDASLRTWLYRIATNACLDALRRRTHRRSLPFEVMAPVGPDGMPPAPDDVDWVEPFPDRLIDEAPPAADPEAAAVRRETVELVFVAALQHLPPRQRAVLVSRDVLGWSARATAALLDMSEASVKSALQRARATMQQRLPARREEWASATAVSEEERAVLLRYVEAHQRDDVDGLMEVLAEDVRVAYPQLPLWSDDRAAFIAATWEHAPPGEHRFVETVANRQPAVAIYHRAPGEQEFRLVALEVLRVTEGRVTEIVDFDLPELWEAFGLPATLR